jgi:hypothetical protein
MAEPQMAILFIIQYALVRALPLCGKHLVLYIREQIYDKISK